VVDQRALIQRAAHRHAMRQQRWRRHRQPGALQPGENAEAALRPADASKRQETAAPETHRVAE